MMMRVVCSSSYKEEASKSPSLLDQEQSSVTLPAQQSRLPQLVQSNDDKTYCNELENLPLGWSVNNANSGWRSTDDWKPVISTLKGGSMTHAFFDIFRPLSEYNEKEQSCKTDFLVLFRYCQVRPNQSGASKDDDIGVQEYRGSALQ